MSSEDVQTNLRLPTELKERLVEVASANKRSLSAEVAARLEASFTASASAKESIPIVIKVLEDKLSEAALATWTYKSQVHDFSHLVQLLVARMDAGDPLTEKERQKILSKALEGCQGNDHHADSLAKLFGALEEAATHTEAATHQIINSVDEAVSQPAVKAARLGSQSNPPATRRSLPRSKK